MTKPLTPSASPGSRARAEAAAWIARLHGPDRSADLEQGLQDWLRADPRHALAFDQASENRKSTGIAVTWAVLVAGLLGWILSRARRGLVRGHEKP